MPEPALRARHLTGHLSLSPANRATRALVRAVMERLVHALHPHDPQIAQHALAPDALFSRITAVRLELVRDPSILSLTRDVLAAFHADLDRTYFDPPRLRAVVSGGHRNPRAHAVYLPHRDTWFANPAAQINWWIALRDVPLASAFDLYPAHFHRAIPNTSSAFDYDAFTALGGFQAPNPAKHHPAPTVPIVSPALRVAVPEAHLLRFAGSHLHATAPHDTGVTRLSIEFRAVDVRDLHTHAPSRDDRSRGAALAQYLHARTFTPFANR